MVEGNAMKGFICPRCRLLVSVSTEILGEDIACPGCRSRIRIPSIDQSMGSIEPIVQTMAPAAKSQQNFYSEIWRNDLPIEVLAAQTRYLPWAMLLPAFAVGSGLLVSLIVLLFFTNLGPVEQVPSIEVARVENSVQITKAVVAPTTADVKELLTQLSQAKTFSEVTPWLRDAPDLQTKLANHYKDREVSFSPLVKVHNVEKMPNKKGSYLFRALLDGRVWRGGVVSQNSSGNWVIDWESYVVYCDISWDELPKLQPKQPCLVRAIRERNEYYNQGFNSNEWQSFKLSYPQSEKILIGYVRRDGSSIHQLLPIGNRVGSMQVMLKIHFPENVSDPRLVIIDEVVAGDWIYTNPK